MSHSKNKIDLHGVRHHEVRNKVIRFVEDNWNGNSDIEIVTGHSVEMKSIVKNILEEYRLDYQDGKFFNNGVIVTHT